MTADGCRPRTEFAFDMGAHQRTAYIVVGGYQKDGLGGLVPISPSAGNRDLCGKAQV